MTDELVKTSPPMKFIAANQWQNNAKKVFVIKINAKKPSLHIDFFIIRKQCQCYSSDTSDDHFGKDCHNIAQTRHQYVLEEQRDRNPYFIVKSPAAFHLDYFMPRLTLKDIFAKLLDTTNKNSEEIPQF